ncbi:phasin family protein [Arhodomonas aquaeolei]|uniref:phasin family protein n=1 Tax=Arhodomonas aquaeolei TaxID=2369 RepID=UPI002168BD1F|nr:phasin family protein [Arhodomonas aquaeolei]MCS4503392.1 phasin family protein [Arhodomonas aquaeolei]
MYEQMIRQMFDQMNEAGEPARRFATTAIDHAEKAASRQIESARTYVGLGVEQLRAASAVRDAASLQDYVARQQDIASRFGRRVTDDLEAFAGIGRALAESAGGTARRTQTRRGKSTAGQDKSAAA